MTASALEIMEHLADAGFKPCLTGSCWLAIKLPEDEVIIDDVDIFCPDFDPARSPVDISRERAPEGEVRYQCGPHGKVEIIKTLAHGIRVDPKRDWEEWQGIRWMASNEFWLAAALNKVANHLSIRMEEHPYWSRYKIIMSLANCMLAQKRGLGVNPKRAASLLSNDLFTNSRVAHLYNTDVIYAAAVIVWKYYLHGESSPDALVMEFCDGVVKPISHHLGVY